MLQLADLIYIKLLHKPLFNEVRLPFNLILLNYEEWQIFFSGFKCSSLHQIVTKKFSIILYPHIHVYIAFILCPCTGTFVHVYTSNYKRDLMQYWITTSCSLCQQIFNKLYGTTFRRIWLNKFYAIFTSLYQFLVDWGLVLVVVLAQTDFAHVIGQIGKKCTCMVCKKFRTVSWCN
jgi:hypothetical protein